MPKNSKVGYAVKANDGLDVPADMKMGRLPTPLQLSSYIKKVTQFSESEYHETDRLEVKEVIRNKPGVRLGVRGILINGKSDPGLVIPAQTNTTTVPLVGEHVNVIEREGVVYFTDITNRKNSVNENSIPGVVGDYDPTTKYGKNFRRKKVKPIDIGEGCITFEGRFGQTLHFDGHDNTPKIKISTHVDESDGDSRKEKIDGDDSSIYLLSRGMKDKFDGNTVEGKKVLIKSNGIFISGDDVRLGSSVEAEIEPVVLGNKLKELLDEVFTGTITQNNAAIAANTAKLATLAAIQPPTPQSLEEINSLTEQNVELGEVNIKLQTSIRTATYLSSTVKTV